MTSILKFLIPIALLMSFECSAFAKNKVSIRRVDFRNFTFHSSHKKFSLHDGTYKEGEAASWYAYALNAVKYVDFDGDGNEEALVVVDFKTSGTLGHAKEYFVFASSKGAPRMIFHEWREKPRQFRVKGRTIIITAPFWKDGGLCCPAGVETSVYRWQAGRFVRSSRQREYRDPNTKWWL